MAIVNMQKFTLLALHDHKPALLKELQVFGDLHFRDLRQEELEQVDFLRPDHSPQQCLHFENELDRVQFTLKKLAPYAPKTSLTAVRPSLTFAEFDDYTRNYDYGSVCDTVRKQDDLVQSIRAESARLRAENEGLRSWRELDVSPADLDRLETVRALAGTVNKNLAASLQEALEETFPTIYAEFLGAYKDETHLLLLIPTDQYEEASAALKDLGFTRSNLSFREIPADIIRANENRIGALEEESRKALEIISEQGHSVPELRIVSDYFQTALERERARQNFLAMDSVVLMEGWVPAENASRLEEILTRICGSQHYLELEEVERDSNDVPIKLKSNPITAPFTSITAMYSMPKYNELDPTPVLTPFYWLFFGLMVGDVGYGLLVMLGTACALLFLDLKDSMKLFMRFFFLLGISTVVGGFLYGSIFGVTFFAPLQGPDGPKAILDTETDIVLMLVASVGLGVIHIIVGLLTKAYVCLKRGSVVDALCDGILWILTLLAAIGYLLGSVGVLNEPLATASMWAFWGCVVLLALTQGRSSPSLGGKIGNGLYGVYGLTSYVGDLVSYTRIVALALSGAYIAFSFNLMITILPAGPVRIIAGAIIAVLGQSLNLGLALLGAYVHTCRLQYVEFFGKFYDGGGVVFSPLKLKHEHVHIIS